MLVQKNKMLGAFLLTFTFIAALPVSFARADEGMFMMDKIAKLPLAQKGLKISPTEIYNPAGGGLSEAVVSLSIGCTGEFVSPDGLILTNHHCAFDALVANSTPEKNYGENGYKANSRAEELLAPNYSVTITLKSEDVTAQVLNGINAADKAAVKARVEQLQKEDQARAETGVNVQIQELNGGLYYYKFHRKQIDDVRIVYAPPKNIGFYGGDPDNFEWTRHCGDFAFLRAYVGKDGKSAPHSKENVPYKPRKFLTINTGGVKENDFMMIMGYPGSTNRYRESFSIAYNQDVQLPFTVDWFNAQIQALEMVGRENAEKRVKLQADIFSLANSLKAYEGGILALRRAGLVAQRQAEEARLMENSALRAKYGDVVTPLRTAYGNYTKTGQRDLILRNLVNIAPVEFIFAAASGQADKAELKAAAAQVAATEPIANRELLKFLIRRASQLPADQRIAAFEKRFGSLQGDARSRAEDEFARKAFESQILTTEKGLSGLADMSAEQVRASNEPLVALVAELGAEIAGAYQRQQALGATLTQHRLPYTRAMIEMKNLPGYPDANFTQRFTYGFVKGFIPREAVVYSPFTTLNGVFEKDTGREPFNAPAKLRDLWQRKDFGQYAVNGTVPVNFISTNDIIGGNSGSPVLNANGEQVGIAFDSNFEGLGNDFFHNDAYGRTISVDIRYVLFVTEKFGEAGWILNEMKINGKAATAKK